MTHRNTWKTQERRVSRLFGSRRTPLSGSNSGHDTESDSLSPLFYIEAKYRKHFSVVEWHKKITEKANKEKKTPILALKTPSSSYDYLLIRRDHVDEFIKKWLLIKSGLEICRGCSGSFEKLNHSQLCVYCEAKFGGV